MKVSRSRIAIIILMAMLTAVAGCAGRSATPKGAGSAGLTKVVMATAIDSLVYGPLYLAQHQGFFSQEGIDVSIVNLGSGGNAILALQGGEVHFVAQSGGLFTAAERGIHLIATALLTKDETLDLVVQKDIVQKLKLDRSSPIEQRLAILKGASVGITSPGGAADLYTRYLMANMGLAEKDVKIVSLGSGPGMAAGLQQKQVDAFLVSPPIDVQAEKDGYGYVLVRGAENPAFKDTFGQTVFTRFDYYEKNKETVGAVNRAVARGINFILDHPDEAKKILHKFYYTTYKEEVVSESMDILAMSFPRSGMMTADWFKHAVKANRANGGLSKDLDSTEGAYWTNEFVKQVK